MSQPCPLLAQCTLDVVGDSSLLRIEEMMVFAFSCFCKRSAVQEIHLQRVRVNIYMNHLHWYCTCTEWYKYADECQGQEKYDTKPA